MAKPFRPVKSFYVNPEGHRVPKGTPGARKVRKRSRVFYGQVKNPLTDTWKRVKLCEDRTASEMMLGEFRKKAALQRAGVVDPYEDSRKRPLTEHLTDFEAHLGRKRTHAGDARQEAYRARRVIERCGFTFIPDIQASRVESCVEDLCAEEELGTQTGNYYLRAAKHFCRWLVRDRRTNDNPLSHLTGKTDTEPRHARRALTEEELPRVLDAALTSEKEFRGLTGRDRRFLYLTAMATGFRVSELASLVPESFNLDVETPTATVASAHTKNKKLARQPLPPDVAAELQEYLADQPAGQPVWPGTWTERAAAMLRIDLKAAGIPYRDEENRVADFHALRHSYISALARSGVHPKIAQELARHSDIKLTMGIYTHVGLYDLAAAVAGLSILPPSAPSGQHQQLVAMGTAGELVEFASPPVPPRGAQTGDSPELSPVVIGSHEDDEEARAADGNPRSRQDLRAIESDCIAGERSSGGWIRTTDSRLMKPLL